MPAGLNRIGLALGLASISIFFGVLIFVYWFTLRAQGTWVHYDIPITLWFSTALLVAASITIEQSRFTLRRGQLADHQRQVLITTLLGGGFLLLQALAALQLVLAGVAVRGNPHGSMFYIFAATHGIHLLGGLAYLGWLLWRAQHLGREGESELRRQRTLTQTAAVYWHFMGVLWLCLFALLYYWGDPSGLG